MGLAPQSSRRASRSERNSTEKADSLCNAEQGRFQMNRLFAPRLGTCLLIAMLVFALRPTAQADPIPARHLQGTVHGFLEMRSPDGQVLASGDSIQVLRGGQVTTHTLFTFKDGSTD